MSEQWLGLHNQDRHEKDGSVAWCHNCEGSQRDQGTCWPIFLCRCCLEAEVAARRAQVIDYEVAFDEAVTAQCRDIVMDALRGKQALEVEVETLRSENAALRWQVRQDHCPFCFGSCACDGEGN